MRAHTVLWGRSRDIGLVNYVRCLWKNPSVGKSFIDLYVAVYEQICRDAWRAALDSIRRLYLGHLPRFICYWGHLEHDDLPPQSTKGS